MPPAQPDNDEERALRRELAAMFLEDCPKSCQEIERAMAAQDGPGLKLAAHTLKGSLRVFNDPAAFEAALRMEQIGRDANWAMAASAWLALQQETRRVSALLTAELASP